MTAGREFDAKAERKARALEDLARAFRHFTVEELDWDWGCNIGPDTRKVLRLEYARRGILPGTTGRGRRRGGSFV